MAFALIVTLSVAGDISVLALLIFNRFL